MVSPRGAIGGGSVREIPAVKAGSRLREVADNDLP